MPLESETEAADAREKLDDRTRAFGCGHRGLPVVRCVPKSGL
jgi:hypothetical protein